MAKRVQEMIRCACGCGEEMLSYSIRLRNGRPELNKKVRYLQYHHVRIPELKDALRKRASGVSNNNWKGGVSVNNAATRQSADHRFWTFQVLKKFDYTCQLCGKHARQAHHIKKFSNFPELRLDVNNGIALCKNCHEFTYGKEKTFEPMFLVMIAKRVNSGNILPGQAGDNPEPSVGGDVNDGATTRGIEYFVRQTVHCDHCGKKITRCLSFIRKSKKHFCSKDCQYKVILPPRTPSPKGMR